MIRSISLATFVSAALTIFAAAPSYAALIEADLFNPGDGFLIRDTDNNREWVDVTKTTGISVNSALAIYAPLGFSLATIADTEQLFIAAGATTINAINAGNLAAAQLLEDLMEHEFPFTDTNGNTYVHGYAQLDSAPTLTISRFRAYTDNLGWIHTISNGTSWTFDFASGDIGTFLVRDIQEASVPAPGALALLGFGLLGLGMRRQTA